jgi:hypothetical protein
MSPRWTFLAAVAAVLSELSAWQRCCIERVGFNPAAERSAGGSRRSAFWRATNDDDEHYVYAIAL